VSGPAITAIRENLKPLAAAGGDVQVLRQDARVALLALADSGVRFDVIYLDPPYDSPWYEPLIGESAHLLEEAGLVVAEHFHKRALPETIGRLARARSVRIGDHRLSFYARHDGGQGPPEGPGRDGRGGAS
jgi:16S rRNA G966 N2-methylase RsmD